MEHTTIVTYNELIERLKKLKLERDIQEMTIRYTFNDFIEGINIFSIFKSSKSTTGSSNDLSKIGLSTGLNLIIGLIFGKHRNIKGFLSALMAEYFTTKLVNNNSFTTLLSNIGTLIFNKISHRDTYKT